MGGLAAALVLTTVAAAPANASRGGEHWRTSYCARGTVTLTAADEGHRVCVRHGARVHVVLQVDPTVYPYPEQWWTAVVVSGRGLTPDLGGPRPMPARGVTLAYFKAIGHGRATLSSTRSPCPPNPTGPACHVLVRWSATVVVG